ncbi:MAG TPA: hypothetical protein ENN46_04025 [Candidatus Woesearchaeota archaeon]|nr:hypothetical protein [Candidatus Woesearchaeota archaeon]
MENIYIAGTSHIAQESKHLVHKSFAEFKPDVVALELDISRFQALMSDKQETRSSSGALRQFGIRGFLFFSIGRFIQKRLSKVVNTEPGIEMKEAIRQAKAKNIPIMLIDRPINTTIKRVSATLNLGFLFSLLKDLLTSPFKAKKRRFNLNSIPNDQLVDYLISEMKKTYPQLYKVLVEERDIYMSKKIIAFAKQNPDKKLLVVVGLGHKAGISQRLNQVDILG